MRDIIKIIRYTEVLYIKKQLSCMIWIVLNVCCTLFYPKSISFIIDKGINQGDVYTVIENICIMLLIGILIILTNYIQQIKCIKIGREICEVLRNKVFHKLCNTTYKFWNENRVGDVLTVINQDISSVEKLFTTIINNGIVNSIYFIGIIIVLFFLNSTITFYIILILVIFIFLQKRNGEKVKKGMVELREKIGEFNSNTQEMISHMPDVQLIYSNYKLEKKYSCENHIVNNLYIQQIKKILIAKNMGIGFNTLSIFIVLFIGTIRVMNNTMSIGSLFSIIIYVQQLYTPAISLTTLYNDFNNIQPNIRRILDLLEDINIAKYGTFIPKEGLRGKISFNHVTFSYGENRKKIFTDINLNLEAGKIYGIIGDNGKGKSTFVRLLVGLCSPDMGEINIDDINLESYDLEYLRRHIGYLPQKPFILTGENLIIDKKKEEILKSFSFTIKEEIRNSELEVSGGEKQKLALLHLLSDDEKDIFILDEPTSAIDLRSEEMVCKQIKKLLKGKTVLIITHRRNILKICDEIIDFNSIYLTKM